MADTARIPFKEQADVNFENKTSSKTSIIEEEIEEEKKLHIQYSQFMRQYLEFGHMEQIPPHKYHSRHYYIPAQLQNSELFSIHRPKPNREEIWTKQCSRVYGFTVEEVEKMYLQIPVNKLDHDYQRNVWRFDPRESM